MNRAKAVFSKHRKVTSQAGMETSHSPTTLQQLSLCKSSLQLIADAENSKSIQNSHDVNPDGLIPVL